MSWLIMIVTHLVGECGLITWMTVEAYILWSNYCFAHIGSICHDNFLRCDMDNAESQGVDAL
jgi:hypothetical protein